MLNQICKPKPGIYRCIRSSRNRLFCLLILIICFFLTPFNMRIFSLYATITNFNRNLFAFYKVRFTSQKTYFPKVQSTLQSSQDFLSHLCVCIKTKSYGLFNLKSVTVTLIRRSLDDKYRVSWFGKHMISQAKEIIKDDLQNRLPFPKNSIRGRDL